MASIAVLLTAATALAAPPHFGCPVGPTGSGNSTIGHWQRMDSALHTSLIVASGGSAAEAEAEFAHYNRNADGFICTMIQILPNDASGADTWFVSRDNTSAAR